MTLGQTKGSTMSARDLVSEYLDGSTSMDEFHAALQVQFMDRVPDPFSAEVLRLIGEATSAEWPEDDLRRRLEELMSRSHQHGRIYVADVTGYMVSSVIGHASVHVTPTRSPLRIRGSHLQEVG